MADNKKTFVPSVADAIIRETQTKQVVAIASTLLNSSLKQDIKEKEINGGRGHKLQFTYGFGKTVTIELDDCSFKEEYLAMSNGVNIVNEMSELFSYRERHEVKNNTITLDETPIANTPVYVINEETEELQTIMPSGKYVTINLPDGKEVLATYRKKGQCDTINIDGSHYPTAYELTLLTEIVDADNNTVSKVEIEVPRWKPDGKFELNMKSDDVVSPKISGKALDKGVYAKVKIVPVDTKKIGIQRIVAEPKIQLKMGDIYVPQIIGMREGMYSNIILSPDKFKLTSKNTATAKVTDDRIQYVAKGETEVEVSLLDDKTKTDIIKVVCE